MGFFDNPDHLPQGSWPVGSSREGTITGLQISRNTWGNVGLKYQLDGQEAWAGRALWDTLAAARVDIGDRVRITKTGEDRSNGKVRYQWTVERMAVVPVQPPVQPAAAPMYIGQPVQTGPTW